MSEVDFALLKAVTCAKTSKFSLNSKVRAKLITEFTWKCENLHNVAVKCPSTTLQEKVTWVNMTKHIAFELSWPNNDTSHVKI